MVQTIATGETLDSEESEDEIQSQEVVCTPKDAFDLSTMVFNTWEEGKSYYMKYAKEVGFLVKIGSSKKKHNKDNEKDKVMFVCNKNGTKKEANDGAVVKQRKRNRTEKT